MNSLQITNPIEEPIFTSDELAERTKLDPTTIRKIFVDEPGVIRLGRSGSRDRRKYYALRIPSAVAQRVISRMTAVGDS